MSATFQCRFNRWGLGLLSSTIQGGAVAVKAFIATTLAHGVGLDVPALNLKGTAAVFVVAGGYHFFDYLGKNPLINLVGPVAVLTPPAAAGPASLQPETNKIKL